ncbi:hypothetical protein [Rhizobium azibense]|uniref:Uncharacterized protein n=1 Tax=Rhizobium azibense TaxID=1136135 RepID=A0A4V2VDU4_9HYPH|nr:hypothetical protein [Rhizobium azibense]TCU34045.1 hypothetical protein EV129_11328 [Rhizobium azibense]
MTNDPYKPQPPLPMPEYEPLMVTPVESNRKPGQVVAFMGRQLCFFENGSPVPQIGAPVEVMITRALYSKKEDGLKDWNRVFALLLQVVTSEWTLIEHNGFECSGSMCSTTATMIGPKHLIGDKGVGPWLTPGRTMIYEAGNVNAGLTWKQPYVPRRPGKAYINTAELLAGKFPLRIQGLARVEDGMYAHAVKVDARPPEVTS